MPVPIAVQLATQVGIPLARNFFGGKDAEKARRKAEEENRRVASMSNFINSLSPRAQHRPNLVQPELKQGRISRALGAAQTGLDAFNTFDQIKRAAASEASQQELQKLAIAKGKDDAKVRGGKAAARLFGAPQTAPELQGLDPTIRRQIEESSQPVIPERLSSDIGRAAFLEENRALRQGAEDRQRGRERGDVELKGARLANTGAILANQKAFNELGATPAGERDLEALTGVATGFGLVSPGLSQDALFGLAQFKNIEAEGAPLTAVERANIWTSYKTSEQDRQGALDAAVIERIDAFHDQARRDPNLQTRGDLSNGYLLGLQGLLQGDGFGDIQGMKMLARLQDPGSVVRQEEFNTLMEALGFAEQTELRLTNKFWEGEQLNQRGRRAVFELLDAAYVQRSQQLGEVASTLANASLSLPGMLPHQELFDTARTVYDLPAMPEDLVSTVRAKLFPKQGTILNDTAVGILEDAIRLQGTAAESTGTPRAVGIGI